MAADALSVPALERSPIAMVDLRCAEGQTDLNHASVAELQSSLLVSRPIAERIVASRPHNGSADLLVVPGIGAGRKINASDLCATPMTAPGSIVPAVPAWACPSDGSRVDLAIADRARLTRRLQDGGLGLAEPVADRLLQWRSNHPLPTLDHATIVEGIGPGRLAQWQKAEAVCLTPPPFIASSPAGNTYTASLLARARAERVELATPAGSFALGVPHGTLDQDNAWATVEDIPDQQYRGPRAEFMIHGPWQAPDDVVYLSLPPDPFESQVAATAPQVILNPGTTGAEFVLGRKVAEASNGQVTIATSHLSIAESSRQFALVVFYLPDSGTFADQAEGWAREHITNLGTGAPGCDPDVTTSPGVDVRAAPNSLMTNANALGRPIFYRCVQGPLDDELTFRFANNSALAYRVAPEQSPTVNIRTVATSGDAITEAQARIYASQVGSGLDHLIVIPPAAVATGSLQEVLSYNPDVTYDPLLTSSFWAGRNLGSVLTASQAAVLTATNCFDAVLDADLGYSSLVNCAEAAGVETARAASRLFAFLDSGHTLKDAVGAGLGRLGVASGNVEGSWHFHYDRIPPRPDTQPTDGSVGSSGGQGAGILLKRSNSIAAYYLVDGVAHPVPDGGTYICLAERVPTMFNVDEREWAGLVTTVGADAACPATGLSAVRSLTPETVRNFLLRTGDGSETYLVGTNGFRIPLFDGASHFNCLTESYLVWDWVSAQELTRFQRHPTIAATGCL